MGEPLSKEADSGVEPQLINFASEDSKNWRLNSNRLKMDKQKMATLGLSDSANTELDAASITAGSTTGQGLIRRKHRLDIEKICKICGDKAVAYNFNVISCESCKTFFRRNAHKAQKPCQFEGTCEITVNTRRFCPLCRLKKCVSAGMRADMILDETEKQARMEKILNNRKKRQETSQQKGEQNGEEQNSVCPICNPGSDSIDILLDPESVLDVDLLLSELTETDAEFGDQAVRLNGEHCGESSPGCSSSSKVLLGSGGDAVAADRNSGDAQTNNQNSEVSAPWTTVSSTTDILRKSGIDTAAGGQQSNGDSRREERQKFVGQFLGVAPEDLPTDPHMYWTLTSQEQAAVSIIVNASQEVFPDKCEPLKLESCMTQMKQMTLEDSMSGLAHFSKNIISFLKKIPDFRVLHMNDQQAALKSSTMVPMCILSSISYSAEKDAWLKETGVVSFDLLQQVYQNEKVVTRLKNVNASLKRILKTDMVAYVMLMLMAVFDPLATNITDRQTVNSIHDKYSLLLKHYLESKFSYKFASRYCHVLEEMLEECKETGADLAAMLCNWKDLMEPLLKELLDVS